MVVTDDTMPTTEMVRIKEEVESDTDTTDSTMDTTTDTGSCSSSPPHTSPSSPPIKRKIHKPLPMDTVILVAKCPDGSKSSVVFRSLLRSRKSPGRVEKIRLVKSPPVTEIKNASMPMRANLKQQLQRQQLYEQEKRQKSGKNGHITGSIGINVPHVVESSSVPSNVLQVRTQLQHPTKYHVRQNQKRQVQNFLQEQQGGNSHLPIQSLPSNLPHPAATQADHSQQQHHNYIQASSSAPDPDLSSPLVDGSLGAEFIPTNFDLLGDLCSVEPLELGNILTDSDLIEIQPSLGTDGLNQAGMVSSYDGHDTDGQASQNGVGINSCPTGKFLSQSSEIGHPGMMSMQDELWRKERIKKDNHNMIERRRRFNINDRIKELGGLLPKTMDPDSRQNKGSILKASVDYIKALQDEQKRCRGMIDEKKKAELDLRKVLIRINQMNLVMKSHGIDSGGWEDLDLSSTTAFNSSNFLASPLSLNTMTHQAPVLQNTMTTSQTFLTSTMSPVDDLMDESSPVGGDPMLMSAPVSPDADGVGFDFFDNDSLHK